MSRAFVKEDDGTAPPALPDLPQGGGPNHVTPAELTALRSRLSELADEAARLRAAKDDPDAMNDLAVAERDIRYFERQIDRAVVADPAKQPHDAVYFGAEVDVIDEEDETRTFRIVGEHFADAARGRISPASPLARALTGSAVGDAVTWRKPSGDEELEIAAIRYPGD